MVSRTRGGKAFISLGQGEQVCRPSVADPGVEQKQAPAQAGQAPAAPVWIAATHVACASVGGRILSFEIGELKLMEKGGRGLTLIDLEPKDSLAGAAAYTRSVRILGIGRGGKPREEQLEIRSLNNARAARARKGRAADLGFKPASVTRIE
jgi:topoisomerase-4 subunit A